MPRHSRHVLAALLGCGLYDGLGRLVAMHQHGVTGHMSLGRLGRGRRQSLVGSGVDLLVKGLGDRGVGQRARAALDGRDVWRGMEESDPGAAALREGDGLGHGGL